MLIEVKLDEERTARIGERAITATFKTIDDERKIFSERKCQVNFKSDALFQEGINLVLIAQKRDYWLGTYDVTCTIDGELIKETGVRGFFEHVWSRY